ncbi:MAG: nicotinate (nicotinamide) nucleotide adenylyltransferase [Alicyclobacillus mali]|uniref:nicotinate (nicotinamide) nucleotide adenylyltransferase n=1 Tax=Alicyclobacillus mali (ex Roth et al. 2021) TaxID=1123961 RepID=UPI00082E0171|nr:nicotinate (nicotinamide) nucleotide adenylyltransferase [Alicyclobacillus mali (ex Roth et al. 2021)]MCL6487619.1 nicotinate (nicotinamide) nucleotide adenylyltransferase [Alicyclobacillus mali (ex Roth et al. 2021)]
MGEETVWYTEANGERTSAAAPGRILLFGGTFDPPHVGHLTMAQIAYEQVGADEVWWMPAAKPPHKAEIDVDTFAWRFRMVEALIGARRHMRVTDVENRLPKPSYTVDTLRALISWYPEVEFLFLLGADSLQHLPEWHGAEELCEMVRFVVARRPGYDFDTAAASARARLPHIRMDVIDMPMLDVSSTWVRDRLDRRLDVCGLVPDPVLEIWRQGPEGGMGSGWSGGTSSIIFGSASPSR